ncbi:MAG: hypothetical protein ACTHJR_10390 [Sphingomonas sp.]|uniref:hypothetical protein n=1 Tax=Sphingomonas sp. TaxID=28214 RepID=UPI003F7E1224
MLFRRADHRLIAILLLALALVCAVQAYAYAPGLMTWDSIRQYGQALSGDFDDWHPPAMEWLWRRLLPVAHGPAPMFAIQLALYWGAFVGFVLWAVRSGRRGLAIAFALAAMLPLSVVLMAEIIKDSLMAGLLLAASAILVAPPIRGHPVARIVALLLIVCAATLRFNALPACLPLAIALLPASWRATRVRFGAAILLAAAVIAAALPLANRALGAKPSGVGLSLVIFDLGGITRFSGTDAFPADDDVDDPVAVNRHCYKPERWDSYSWWVADPCALGFDGMDDVFKQSGENPYRHWLGAVLAHPVAYAEHRLTHFNINIRFLVHDEVERPVMNQIPPNDWGFRLTPNPALTWFDRLARWSAHTPLGWPVCWMALALGLLMVAPGLPSRRLVIPLALSGLLYALGYFPASVACELRYHLWTMLAILLAALIAGADMAGGAMPGRRRLLVAAAPVLLVTILCVAWRLT